MNPHSARWIDRVSPLCLAIARVGIGILFLIRTTGLAVYLDLHIAPRATFLLGWPGVGDPGFGAPFILPRAAIIAACVSRTVAALLFTLGILTRRAGVTAALLAYLVQSQDPIGFNMTMHVLFLGMFVLAATDAGCWLALRPDPMDSLRSGFALVRIWVASIYVWAGLSKLNPDWLSGRVLEAFLGGGVIHGPIASLLMASSALPALVAPVVAVAEMGLGLLLLVRATRRAALVAAYSVHLCFEVTLAPDLFGWAMAFLLLTFIGDLGTWRCVFASNLGAKIVVATAEQDPRRA